MTKVNKVSVKKNLKNNINSTISYYKKTKKKQKIDKCNICGHILPLTWDHVPPKFCFNDISVKYNSMMQMHSIDRKSSISQNGIKFRTICDNCNNNLLGAEYDREYKKLVDCLYSLYITPGEIGQYVIIQGLKINRIARAIVGHMLASREDYTSNKFESELRNFFLDKNALPPKNMKLLYYTYIYNTIMIIRDIVPNKIGNLDYDVPDCFMSCLNTFLMAFILADKCENTCGLYDMFQLCTNDIDEEIDFKVDLLSYLYPNHKCARHPYWPCNVSDEESGVSMVLATEVSQYNSVMTDVRNLKKHRADKNG